MTLRIYGPQMYLELARSFSRAEIELKRGPDLQTPDDLPVATQVHMQFVMTAATVIFSVSFLEGYVNQWFDQLLTTGLDLSPAKHILKDIDQIYERIRLLQDKYCTEEKRTELFRNTKLTEKIKELYRVFGTIPPYKSSDVRERKLWESLLELQALRNDLIHLKPEFLRSPKFMNFVQMDEQEREGLVGTTTVIAYLMTKQFPLIGDNFSENVLIAGATLTYANNHPFEEFLLGYEYSEEEKRQYLTRRPPRRR